MLVHSIIISLFIELGGMGLIVIKIKNLMTIIIGGLGTRNQSRSRSRNQLMMHGKMMISSLIVI